MGLTPAKPAQSLLSYTGADNDELGLTYVRVPTWLPCRLQIYFNGHNWLAVQLRKRHIPYELRDNAFLDIGDWPQAQRIADDWRVKRIHFKLDEFGRRFCPIFADFAAAYHWSIDQCEYATDIVFRRQASGRDLREPEAHGHSQRKSRPHRHFSGQEVARQLSG
jgi:hypothetical protein